MDFTAMRWLMGAGIITVCSVVFVFWPFTSPDPQFQSVNAAVQAWLATVPPKEESVAIIADTAREPQLAPPPQPLPSERSVAVSPPVTENVPQERRISLNEATVEQLDALPGIGPTRAAAIVAYREQHGPFRTIEQVLEVKGIGQATLDRFAHLVTVP